MLCDRCGSIDVVRARTRLMDKVIRLFTGKNAFACRRCGWRGRKSWGEDERVERPKTPRSGDSADSSFFARYRLPV